MASKLTLKRPSKDDKILDNTKSTIRLSFREELGFSRKLFFVRKGSVECENVSTE